MGTHPIFESDFDCLTEREKMGNPNQAGAPGGPTHPDCPPPAYSDINAPPGPSMAPPLAGFAPQPVAAQPYPFVQAPPVGFNPDGQPQQPYAPQIIHTQPGQPMPTAPLVGGQTTVIIQQPRFGTQPVLVQCPYCHQQAMTKVEHESGLGTWLICGGMCLFGLSLGCCLIPFCINDLKDARHKCPNCKRTIHVKKFIS